MGILTMLAPMFASGGSGILVRILMIFVRGSQTRKNNRESAINHRISNNTGTYDETLDDDSRDTANFIAHGCFWIFAIITLTCLAFPTAQFDIFLPDTVEHRTLDLLIFSYSWHSDLGNSVLTINSGGIVYISLNFCIFVMSAFYKGSGGANKKKG